MYSIVCSENTLHAALGLVWANTNNMRGDFEMASNKLIEVDPYRRSQRNTPKNKGVHISAIDFSA